jgi:hypothetical protein
MANDGAVILIERPGPPAVVAELAPVVQAAHAFEVTDVDTNAVALQRVRSLRLGERVIEDHFANAKKAASDAHKSIVAAVNGLVGPLAAARSIYDRKAAEYEQAERKKAAVEQARLQAEARKQEEERSLLAAIEAEEAGDGATSAAIMAEPVSVPMVTVAPAVAKVEGVSTRTNWAAEVFDLLALVKYVAEHPEWLSLVEANEPNLNRMAVSQHEALAFPGVRAVSKTVRSTR